MRLAIDVGKNIRRSPVPWLTSLSAKKHARAGRVFLFRADAFHGCSFSTTITCSGCHWAARA